MAFVYADRVKETSTTVGTGSFVLAGPTTGFRSFASGIGNTNETYYAVVNESTGEWEVGRGTVSGGSLTRDSVLASSNSNLLVSFSAGQKTISAVAPATFFTNALNTTSHATINHSGLPGVPSPEVFTSSAHDGVDHTQPPFSLLNAALHSSLNHSGLPGVPDGITIPTPTSWGQSTVTMTGDIVLTDSSETVQFLDPDGAPRAIDLPTPSTDNPFFFIANDGDVAAITIRNELSQPLTVISTRQAVRCYSNGSVWAVARQDVVFSDNPIFGRGVLAFEGRSTTTPRPFGSTDSADTKIYVADDCIIESVVVNKPSSVAITFDILVNGISQATVNTPIEVLSSITLPSPISMVAGDYVTITATSSVAINTHFYLDVAYTNTIGVTNVYWGGQSVNNERVPLWGHFDSPTRFDANDARNAIVIPSAMELTNIVWEQNSTAGADIEVYVNGSIVATIPISGTSGVTTPGATLNLSPGDLLVMHFDPATDRDVRIGALLDYGGMLVGWGADMQQTAGYMFPFRGATPNDANSSSPPETEFVVFRDMRISHASINVDDTAVTVNSVPDVEIYVDTVLTATLTSADRAISPSNSLCAWWELSAPIDLNADEIVEIRVLASGSNDVEDTNFALWCTF